MSPPLPTAVSEVESMPPPRQPPRSWSRTPATKYLAVDRTTRSRSRSKPPT